MLDDRRLDPDFFEQGEPHDAAGLARQLGIPAGVEWVHILSIGPIRLTKDDVILSAERPLSSEFVPFAPEALRGWDGYYLRMTGCLVHASSTTPPYPRWKVQTTGGVVDIQIWRLRAFLVKALAYAEVAWHPTWGDVRKTIRITQGWESLPPKEQDREILGATGGLRAIEGVLKHAGGRPPVDRDERIERLARAGLKWLKGNRYCAVTDVGRRQIAEAMGDDNPKRVSKMMDRKPSFTNEDVHRRMREILESSAN